ncbi:uncharacterized protein RHO17_004335 [Thomomys bottae]
MVVITRSRAAAIAALLAAQEGTSLPRGPLNKRKKNKKKATCPHSSKGKAPATPAVVGHIKRRGRYGTWKVVPITAVPTPDSGTGPAPTSDRVPNVRLRKIQPAKNQKKKKSPSS